MSGAICNIFYEQRAAELSCMLVAFPNFIAKSDFWQSRRILRISQNAHEA